MSLKMIINVSTVCHKNEGNLLLVTNYQIFRVNSYKNCLVWSGVFVQPVVPADDHYYLPGSAHPPHSTRENCGQVRYSTKMFHFKGCRFSTSGFSHQITF